MGQAKLKLADYSKPLTRSPDALYFERRRCPRRRFPGRCRVTALVSDAKPLSHRICSLQLHDQSDTGLGLLSDAPIERGRTVTVFVQPQGPERGFDLIGTVVRCEPRDDQYHVGLSLPQRLAA